MPLQTFGAISLGQIGAEYIDAAPHSMSEFRGRNGFPATGAISFNQAYGNYGKLVTAFTTATRIYTNTKVPYTTVGYVNGSQGGLNPKTFVHDGVTITITSFASTYGQYVVMTGFTSTQTIGSVWSTMTKGSNTLAATACTFAYSSGQCTWSFPITTGVVDYVSASGTLTFKMT
jgi:hypothetical protein